MEDPENNVVENLDTPIGKEILEYLLRKKGNKIKKLLGNYSLQEFIDERCKVYHEALSDGYQSKAFINGPIGHTGVLELARATTFTDL